MSKRTRAQQRQADNADRMFDSFEHGTRHTWSNITEKEGHTETIQDARRKYEELMRHVEEGRPAAIAYLEKLQLEKMGHRSK